MIQCLVAAPPVVWLAAAHPLALPLASIVLMILLGRYQGLRLSELRAFPRCQPREPDPMTILGMNRRNALIAR
jgi:hypothetical protein